MSSYSLHTADRRRNDQAAIRCPGFITDLILRCADRDEAALASLFDHLYRLVFSIVGSRTPPGAAEALVVATFRRLWEQAPTYDPKLQSAVAWVVAQTHAVRAEFLLAEEPIGRHGRATAP